MYVTRHGRIRVSGGIGPLRASIGSSGPRLYFGRGVVGLALGLLAYLMVFAFIAALVAIAVAFWLACIFGVCVLATWRVWRTPATDRPSWSAMVASGLSALASALSRT
jgi:hypothetical protein